MEKTIQITLSQLEALLKKQRKNCADAVLSNVGIIRPIMDAPTPDLSHLVKNDVTNDKALIEAIDYMKGKVAEANRNVATTIAINGMFDKLFFQMMAKRDERHLKFLQSLLSNGQNVQECDTRNGASSNAD